MTEDTGASARLSWSTRALWLAAGAVLAASLVAVLVYVAATFTTRIPYWGEAETLFEASRLHRGLPLFVDPLVGASDYGPPPSRWYVTYPPILSGLLSLVPSGGQLVAGRVVSTLAWFGSLAWIARSALPACRRNAIAATSLIGGTWVIANFAMVGRPDSLACALAIVGLGRAVARGRIDALSLVLLVLVPWVKPTIYGLPAGALLAGAWVRREPWLLLRAAALTAAVAAAFHLATGGALFEHVVRSNAQPLTLAIWLDRVPPRLPFFLPLFVLAFWHGRRTTDPGLRIAVGALAGALVWMLVAIAKTGSSANYWMEPCIAALIVVARAPGPFDFGRSGPLHAGVTLAAVLWSASASIPASLGHIGEARRERAFVASARARCGSPADGVVAADEPGLELALNGRILAPAYQMAWLVHAGRFPAAPWIEDLRSPGVRCYVIHSGALEAAPDVGRAVTERFERVTSEGDLHLLRARE